MEFVLFLPQMRLSFDGLVARAKAAEVAGFTGLAGMDHLAPPLADDQPMYEAIVTSTWLAAHTERLRLGSLVLCDAFRHPAVLAREAVSIDHASGGRYELGLGWGSVVEEFTTFGTGSTCPADRVQRLRETLEVLKALWAGEVVDFDGEFHHLRGARQAPLPLGHIPIVIGGVGKKTLALVREHADWWNVHVGHLPRLEELLRLWLWDRHESRSSRSWRSRRSRPARRCRRASPGVGSDGRTRSSAPATKWSTTSVAWGTRASSAVMPGFTTSRSPITS